MKNTITLILFILLCTNPAAFAQDKQSHINYITSTNIDKYITFDTASIRVWYALNARDIKDTRTYLDWQILEIGRNSNKYYSYFVWESDSLFTVDYRTNRSGSYSSKLLPRGRNGHGKWNELQYHVLIAGNGKIRTYNREPRPRLYEGYYDEPYPDQRWNLTQETATISGFRCQKATCTFHGRDFKAWFTPEIPLRLGPWKFGGLPGLIIKVYDTNHYYTFEYTHIEQGQWPMRRQKYNQRKPVKRETVLKFERKVNECPGKTLGTRDMDGNIITKTYPYEPLELE